MYKHLTSKVMAMMRDRAKVAEGLLHKLRLRKDSNWPLDALDTAVTREVLCIYAVTTVYIVVDKE